MRKRVLAILLAISMIAPTTAGTLPVYATEADTSHGQNTTSAGQPTILEGEGTTPVEPIVLEEPGEPEEPEKIEAPGEPEEPGKAEEPGNVEEPGEPEEPGKAEDPGEPEEPGKAEEPGESEETETKDQTSEAKATTFTEEELEAVADRPDDDTSTDANFNPWRASNTDDVSMYTMENSLSILVPEEAPDPEDPYDASGETATDLRYDHLDATKKAIYTVLKNRVQQVAAGDLSNTQFDLSAGDDGLSQDLLAQLYNDYFVQERAAEWYQLRDDIFYALYYDLPADFFWSQASYACWIDRTEDPEESGRYTYTFNYRIQVAQEFRIYRDNPSEDEENTDYLYLCNTDLVNDVKGILNDAEAIAHEADGMTLYEALCYFKERVNALVSYDWDAAAQLKSDDEHEQGAWNMIQAFDATPDTNIVCEGYSKAFKYLFDKWKETNQDAAGNTYCYIMEGICGEGHMWNVVHTEDSDEDGNPTYANYVIDLTNSDEEPKGTQYDPIFLQSPDSYMVFAQDAPSESIVKGRTSSYMVANHNYQLWNTQTSTTEEGETKTEYLYTAMQYYTEKEIGITDKGFPVPASSGGNGNDDDDDVSTQNDAEEEVATATRYEHLSTELQQKVYQNIAGQMRKVAEGSQSSTVFSVPVGEGTYDLTEDELVELANMDSNEFEEFTDAIYEALRADLMFDLYWYNNFHYGSSVDTTQNYCYTMQLTVAREYSPNERWDAYEFDTDKAAAAIEARGNADAIAAEADGMTLYEAVCYLKERVCALASYDHPAGQDPGNYPNIAPWHMISTFDTDPDTNIVCESYSRSFKYLFDAWKARNPEAAGEDTYCYYLGGYFTAVDVPNDAAGGHAWNVLHTTVDGENCNYFIDLTNCDEGLSEQGADYTPFSRQPFLRPPYFAQSIDGIGGGKYDDRISQFYYNVGTSSSYNRLKYEYYSYNQETGTYSGYSSLQLYNSSEIDIGTDDHVPALKDR